MRGAGAPRRAAVACVVALVLTAGCSGDDPSVTPAGASPQGGASDESPTEESVPGETSSAPEAESPEPLSLKAVGSRTIRAEPFPDFAVAAGDGVWVTGVTPGAVRYDDQSGEITARVPLDGGVEQAFEVSAGSVWLPTTTRELLRLDAETGDVQERVRLTADPLPEGVMGVVGETAYVIVGRARRPTVLVVAGGQVTDQIPAPRFGVAVRAGYGALWVPTGAGTVERYDLGSGEWTSIPTGPDPRFLDVGFGAVWVMNQSDGSVTRIDARTLETEVLPGYQYPIYGGDITTGGGGVWLHTADSVLRIDPRTREVTHVIEPPAGSGDAVATPRALWITNHDHLAVHTVPLPLPP